MASCPQCRQTRATMDVACPRCGDPPTVTTEAAPSTTEDFETLLMFEESRTTDVAPGGRPSEARVDVVPRIEYASVPADSDPIVNILVDITPEGPPALDSKAGPVAHVILCLDVSASMNHADKYPVLTEALSGMMHDLAAPGTPEVLLSVILFAYGAKTLFRDVPASQLDPREVLAKIDASPLRFGRYTDIPGALKRAGKIAIQQLHAQREMPTRIYVLTDGKPQDLPRTREIMGKIRKLPVDVDGLAFGADADVALLQEFVSGGRGGTVKHVRSETLADAFDRIAEVARRVVSNRAHVEFSLAPGVVGSEAYRYRPGRHRFADGAFTDGRSFRTDLGTFESGRTYSLLFAVRLPESQAASTDIGTIAVRLQGRGSVPVEVRLSVPRTGHELPPADQEVAASRDVLAALAGADVETQVRALRVRRKLYVAERRDPHVVAVLDKAIAALETEGTLAALSASERATLRSHTVTAGGARPTPRREFAAG